MSEELFNEIRQKIDSMSDDELMDSLRKAGVVFEGDDPVEPRPPFTVFIRKAGQRCPYSNDCATFEEAVTLAGSINHPEDAIEIEGSRGVAY